MNEIPLPLFMPLLDTLHMRHFGLTPAVGKSYAEAAKVCLARHHVPPTDFSICDKATGFEPSVRQLAWVPPTTREVSAWRNSDDATRDGAYSIALASVECERGLFAVSRAETRTGADYLLGNQLSSETDDLEEAFRLEVAGQDRGNRASLSNRLRRKIEQLKEGESDTPALACVVGFADRTILLEAVGAENVE